MIRALYKCTTSLHLFKMALSSGHLVMSIISPRGGKVQSDGESYL